MLSARLLDAEVVTTSDADQLERLLGDYTRLGGGEHIAIRTGRRLLRCIVATREVDTWLTEIDLMHQDLIALAEDSELDEATHTLALAQLEGAERLLTQAEERLEKALTEAI